MSFGAPHITATGASWRRSSRARGAFLLAVVWLVLILSLLLTYHLRETQLIFREQRMTATELRLRLAARSAIELILAGMAEDLALESEENAYDAYSDAWGWEALREPFGDELAAAYPGLELSVTIEDEGGKIDLRDSANLEQFAKLLTVLGWTELQSEQAALEVFERTQQALRALREQAGAGGEGGEEESAESLDWRFLMIEPEFTALTLFGEDANFNGRLDDNENDGPRSPPRDNRNGRLERGLAAFATLRAAGAVNPNLAPHEVLLTVPGVSPLIADGIVSARQGTDGLAGTEDDFIFKKLEDLLELTSVSRFREFEYNKMIRRMAVSSQYYLLRVCAVDRKTAQRHRIQACVKKEDGVRILCWLEDSGTQ